MDAYLDIETSCKFEITVVGVFRKDFGFKQLVGHHITPKKVLSLLKGSHRIVTYNGSRFDLPVIRRKLDLDLFGSFESCDLMYSCWRQDLRGGLKAVERMLGIPRRLVEVDGREAMRLWFLYESYKDEVALQRLLEYNREDVMNLTVLQEKLENLHNKKST